MSIPVWPETLPQNILAQGYKGGLPNNLLRQQMDIGPAKVRRRGTVAVQPVTGNILVTPAGLATLKTFYETTLLDGSLRFRWRDPIYGTSLSGVTANLSLANGLAFISNPSTDLSGYEYAKIIVTDSAGKTATGYIKASGTGETYAAPAWADDCADDGTADWSVNDCSIAFDTDHYVTTYVAATQHVYKSVTLGSGKLFLASVDAKNGTYTGAGVTNQIQSGLGSNIVAAKTGTTGADYATFSGYVTPTIQGQVDVYSFMTGAGTYLWKNYFIKQVLTPSATGVTITSTPGGTTYNWTSIEAGFNYNGTSYSIDLYATEMRFTEPPTWNWVDGYYEVALPLEILK